MQQICKLLVFGKAGQKRRNITGMGYNTSWDFHVHGVYIELKSLKNYKSEPQEKSISITLRFVANLLMSCLYSRVLLLKVNI